MPNYSGLGAEGFGKGAVTPVGTPTSGATTDNKIDPGLRFMLQQYQTHLTRDRLNRAVVDDQLFSGELYFNLLSPVAAGSPKAQVFVKLNDESGRLVLERSGADIITTVGDIVIANVPITSIYNLAASEIIQSIEISGQSFASINLSRAEARVDQVHAANGGLTTAYKGNGVVVGILDSGIDWRHPDFSISSSPRNTRIQFLLDYANGGQSGQEWTKAQIDLEPSPVTQIDGPGSRGHGTHVAGAAAGGGKRNTAYIGMAPESDIVFVKGIRNQNSSGGFSNADIVSGTQYILSKARAAGKPAVVNLSLGGHFGPHDGTSLFEQALSGLTRPGHIIVVAAGNSGNSNIHVSYQVQGSGYETALESMWQLEPNASVAIADMWYPPPGNISVGLAAYSPPNYLSPRAVSGAVAPGQKIENVVLLDGQTNAPIGIVTIDQLTMSDPNNNSRRALFTVSSDNGSYPISNYVWSVYTFGTGTFDMWAVSGGNFPQRSEFPVFARQGDNNKSITVPATARKVIAAGSYVSKTSWVDIDGVTRTQGGATLGQISSFSSRGPSRDGRTLPHVAAPGEAILSALSSSLTIGTDVPRADVLQGGGLQKLQGTSLAAPHVAGTVALMLERNKYLTPENVASILASTATPVGASPNNTWGAGKMNALNALLATPPAVDCASLAKVTGYDCEGNKLYTYQLMNAYPNPFNPVTNIGFRIEKREYVEVAVYDVLGRRLRLLVNEVLDAGLHNTVWDGRSDDGSSVASGVYFTRMSVSGFTGTSRLVLLK